MSDADHPKTDQIPITPLHHHHLPELELEKLFGINLSAGGEVVAEWSKLPSVGTRYRVGSRLASGGSGTLYATEDLVLGRRVAIKVPQSGMIEHPSAVARFLQEARIHAHLHHPGIPPLHDIGRLPDGRPFIAMKLIRGRTLAAEVAANPPSADWGRYRRLFTQVCLAVGYAHSKGVIHRDLTPRNVLVSDRGRAQVIDWGLSKVLPGAWQAGREEMSGGTTEVGVPNLAQTDAHVMLGTPSYLAPEAGGGAEVGVPGDVFGLGGILCFILSGRPPGDDPISSLPKSGRGREPQDLVAVAKACLALDPNDRPTSAVAVARLLSDAPPARRSLWDRLFRRQQ